MKRNDLESDLRRWLLFGGVIHAGFVAAFTIAILVGTPKGAVGPGNIMQGTDSLIYRYAASHWPWDPEAARVAPLMPMLLAAVGRNLRAFVVLQSLMWIAVWQWCAYAACRIARQRWIGLALFVVVLTMSLVPELVIWTAAIGSEGFSIIVLVATLASALTALRRPGSRWWVITGALVALSAVGRDTNAILALAVVLVAVAVAVRRRAWWRPAVLVIVLCCAGVLSSNVLANRAEPPRWYYPLQENIVNRVVPVPELLAWFEVRGMPQGEELKSVSVNYYMQYRRLQDGPEFAPFRAWLREDGQSVYARFLIDHPVWQARAFLRDRGYVLNPSVATYTTLARSTPGSVYGAFGFMVFWRYAGFIIGWFIVVALVTAQRRGWRRDDGALRGVLLLSLVTAAAHAFVAYVGDDLEVGRHSLTANVQLRLTLWIATLLFVDRLVEVHDEADEAEGSGRGDDDHGERRSVQDPLEPAGGAVGA